MKAKYAKKGLGLFMIFTCASLVFSLFSPTVMEAIIGVTVVFSWLALLVTGVILFTE